MRIKLGQWMILFIAAELLVGCGFLQDSDSGGGGRSVSTSRDLGVPASLDMNKYPLTKLVCDPFNDNPPISIKRGVKGSLYYAAPGVQYQTAQEYVDKATRSQQSLFFTDVNVPTRMWSSGFATQSSDVVKDDLGAKLIEWFGLKLESNIGLGPNDPEGDYEFAVLADDGVVMKGQLSGVWQTLVSSDGTHPTKMGCSSKIISMTKSTRIPMSLVYFQGPRYHIANVVMWRRASVAGQDQECNKLGNNYFFDPNNGSAPLAAYQGLLSRGWKPLSESNYYLSEDSYNPCVDGTIPVISQFKVLSSVEGVVTLSWSTDIPATSQVLLTNKNTGSQVLTASDNQLRTSHQVALSQLEFGINYEAQAVSVSADLGKAISAALAIVVF